MRISKTMVKEIKPKTTTRKSVKKALEIQDKEQLQEAIRLKAYELFVQRGYQNGYAEQDWLTAEQIVLNESR